jgi:hypothetical protein
MDWHEGKLDIIHDAKLADAAYYGHAEVDGWQRDTEFKAVNNEHVVYHKEGKAKIAYRGTVPSNAKDRHADYLLAMGLHDRSNRFKRAVKTADQVVKKYGKENVSVTGHSLGAGNAAYVSRARGLKSTGFSTPLSVLNKRTYAHHHNISTKADPVAWVGQRTKGVGKQTIAKQTRTNPHAMSNFL